jgi:hypothetical protein
VANAVEVVAQARAALLAKNYAAARTLSDRARTSLAELVALHPVPNGAREANDAAYAVHHDAESIGEIVAALQSAHTLLAHAPGSDPVTWDASIESTAGILRAADATAKAELGEQTISSAMTAIERARTRAAPQIQRARARAEKQSAVQAAWVAICGADPPARSPWDGEIIGSESFIEQGAGDPDSVDVSRCTMPELSDRDCWVSTCDVRARNGFGGMVLNRYRFSVAHGEIQSARRVGP